VSRAFSRTAIGVATLRAAHQLLDGEPKVLVDPIAELLLDPEARALVHSNPPSLQTVGAKALRAHVITRSRWAEDRLAEAAGRGIGQLLVLGAGLDSFAYRQPEWARGLRIFEVDHPDSQRVKRERLAAGGVALPGNLEFVPIDFEQTRLAEGLARSGFDAKRPAFVSCLGVFVYLTTEAVDEVFSYVASLPRGSEIVFTFSSSAAEKGEPSPLAAMAAKVGEPWLSHLFEEELFPKLTKMGFSRIDVLQAAEAEVRYFRGRTDGLTAPRRARMASATV
jgi:methyltransferase (TIGR00027 family)